MYQRKSRLSEAKQQKLIEYFVAGSTARTAADMLGIQPKTAITFYRNLRELIASRQARYELDGEVEVDESYFGGVRHYRLGFLTVRKNRYLPL